MKIIRYIQAKLTRQKPHSRNQRGASLVEVLVAIGITSIMLPAILTALISANAAKPAAQQQALASGFLRSLTEETRSVRESGWSNIATNGTYHPITSANAWTLASGSATSGNFTQQIVISDVQRDSSGTIVSSGGTIDPNTKLVTATVSWTKPIGSSISSQAYFSRWQSNAAWLQTTQANFSAGTLNNTTSSATGGGQVQITAAGHGVSWVSPIQVGTLNIAGNTNANDVYTDTSTNRAYVVNGASMSIINVANPAAPALLGTFNPAVQLNSVYVVGNFAYIASTSNTAELTVVNVSNPAAPVQAGTLNLGGAANANSVYVTGGYAYVGKALNTNNGNDEFYVVDVSNPSTPTLAGSLNMAGAVNSIKVSGNYAYLATGDTTAELTVVDISNKSTPTVVGSFATTGGVAANNIYYDGYYVYLGEANNTGGPEFFILNVTNLSSISQVGSYEVGGAVNGVSVNGYEAFLATARAARQFTVLDLSTISTPTLEGSNTQSTADNIFVANDTAYIASTSNTAELTIMKGSAVAGGTSGNGTFTSQTFNAGAAAGFNYFTFTNTMPVNTTITYQIAANNDNATWNYIGPDGTPFSRYSSPGAIPLVDADYRYFRYKATLNTTNFATSKPFILDTTLNYSP